MVREWNSVPSDAKTVGSGQNVMVVPVRPRGAVPTRLADRRERVRDGQGHAVGAAQRQYGAFAEGRMPAEEGVRIAEAVDHPFSRVMAYWAVGFRYGPWRTAMANRIWCIRVRSTSH